MQLLAQLDRPGATELVVATGRQVAVRINSAYQTLTAAPVTLPQLMHLIRDTQLTASVPSKDKVGDPISIDLDGRALRAQFIRQGADVMLRIEHRPAPQQPARPTPVPIVSRAPTPPRTSEIATGRMATPPHGTAAAAARTPSQPPAQPAPPAPPAPAVAAPAGLLDEPSEIAPGLATLVADARRRNATDLHIAANRPVLMRAVGELIAADPAPRTPAEVEALLLPLL